MNRPYQLSSAGNVGSEQSLPYTGFMAKQKLLARLIVAPSDTDADMLYATRVFIGDPFILLEQKGKRTLVLSDLEIDRAKRTAKADEFLMLSELEREIQGESKQPPPYEKVLAHFLNKRGVKRAMVPATFPLGYAKELERWGVSLETSNGLFWPERETKTAEEIKMLGHALRITEVGMKRAMEVLKASKPGPGKKLKWSGKPLTSEVVRAEIDSAILRAGGLPANTIVAGGDQACDPHERGHGPIYANSLIILDIFPRDAKTGYYGDMTRTVVRGRASEEQRKLWETVRAGQALALKNIKAGVDGLSIHRAIQKLFAERGYPTEVRNGRRVGFFHGTGHGLGLEIHIEDVVIVERDGCRVLSRFPKQLEI
ncbi:MAG: aminopeptidase P family protein [Verrucomicrobia bacterium]|nr:MAG: aminopeptidase P family protein [Verrucomicrobiota bacterium]